jgi:hypothetical protein
MPNKQRLTLAHPAVRASKARWDEGAKYRKTHPQTRNDFGFADWLRFFSDRSATFSGLAKETGLSHQRIQQIYRKYFREVFPDQGGPERYRRSVLERRAAKLARMENDLFKSPALKALVKKVHAAGCVVQALPGSSKSKARLQSSTLLINGHRCSLHRLAVVWRPPVKGTRFYFRTSVNRAKLDQLDAVVFHTAAVGYKPRAFVVPSQILRARLFPPPLTKEDKWIYLPSERIAERRNGPPLIDYWDYEDAWHLLIPPASILERSA